MPAALDRYKVTMKSVSLTDDGTLLEQAAEDYVDVEHLDAYVEDARTRWQSVVVGDVVDHGPAGAHGHYTVHPHMKKA